jgi:eukaryotic-like serine/threonine-protein kinase
LGFHEKTVPDSEKYDALRRVGMLQKLNDAQIWELALAGRWMRLPAHRPIIRENDPGQSLFFLAKGQAKVTMQGRLLNSIGTGECFGEMSYIRGGEIPRQASVDSLTDVTYAEFDAASLEKMSAGCQIHFMRALVRTLVERLEFANVRIAR